MKPCIYTCVSRPLFNGFLYTWTWNIICRYFRGNVATNYMTLYVVQIEGASTSVTITNTYHAYDIEFSSNVNRSSFNSRSLQVRVRPSTGVGDVCIVINSRLKNVYIASIYCICTRILVGQNRALRTCCERYFRTHTHALHGYRKLLDG